MGIFNEDSFIYNPFGAVATADNPTTAYKKQPDLQHALNYDNSVSPDTNDFDYVRSREAAVLKFLEAHSENSHTFRIKCNLPGDEDRKFAQPRKFGAFYSAHYIKFTRVPDIRKCTFGEGKNQKTFEELFGKDFDDKEDVHKKELEALFEKMRVEHDSSITYSYTPEGQDKPISVKMNMGYSLVIEVVDKERQGLFSKLGWDLRKHQKEVRAKEIKGQEAGREAAMAAGEKYEDEKLYTGIMRLDWIDSRYNAVPPDKLLTKEELALKKADEETFNKMYCQLPENKLREQNDNVRKNFDKQVLNRKLELFQRIDHTGPFSDNLKMLEFKAQLNAVRKNVQHETGRTITNSIVRAPMESAQKGESFFERLLGMAMSAVRYR